MKEMIFESPVGPLLLQADGGGLKALSFLRQEEIKNVSTGVSPILSRAFEQLNAYFEGERTTFEIPLAPEGTDFQHKVWKELQQIPYGSTTTYGELSAKLGDEKAIRAVGRANGENPIPIIIPCHRVVGAQGKLVGYAGGLQRKKWLLKHEGVLLL